MNYLQKLSTAKNYPHYRMQPRLDVLILEDRVTPATFTVTNDANSGIGSVRQAILDANAKFGPDIIMWDGPHETLLGKNLDFITESVTFIGISSADCVISGETEFSLFHAEPGVDVSVENITLTRGAASKGGAIYIESGNLSLLNVSIEDSIAAVSGGGIFISKGDLILESVAISGCTANDGDGGAISLDDGDLDASFVTIGKCLSYKDLGSAGGGINVVGNANLFVVSFSECKATGDIRDAKGGGIAVREGNLTLISGSFTQCDAIDTAGKALGGALYYNGNETSELYVDDCSFSLCKANAFLAATALTGDGGAIYINGGRFRLGEVYGVTFALCQSMVRGGAIYIEGVSQASSIQNATFNTCGIDEDTGLTLKGGAISIKNAKATTISIIDSTIFNCFVENTTAGMTAGGGIHLEVGSLLLENVDILSCTSTTLGGGLFIGHGEVAINNSTINGCSAVIGGGIHAQSEPASMSGPRSLTLFQSAIEECTAKSGGGGIAISKSEVFGLQSSTITKCVTSMGSGGGIHVVGAIELCRIDFSVLTENESLGFGGAICSVETDWKITATTIADNSAGNDGGGLFISGGDPEIVGLKLERSTFSGNISDAEGGAIATQGTSVEIFNSTLSDNTADNGGGINLASLGTLNVRYSTFVLNEAITEGGSLNLESVQSSLTHTLEFQATVIAGNIGDELRIPALQDTTVTFEYCALGSTADIDNDNMLLNFSTTQTDALTFSTYADLELDLLQFAGGPTKTHPPIAANNSPLINSVPTSANITILQDQRGLLRPGGSAFDMGAVELAGFSPVVTGFTVNNAEVQRSRITTISVTFQSAISADLLAEFGAISLTRTVATAAGTVGTIVQTQAVGPNGLIVVSPSSGTATTFTLTFENANGDDVSAGVEYGSLSDGRWQLSVPSAGFQSTSGDVTLRRLFGDCNNDGVADGTVDGTDSIAFGNTFGLNFTQTGFNAAFDFNDDGVIDGTDLLQFGNRFGITL